MSYNYKISKFDAFIDQKYVFIDKRSKFLGICSIFLVLVGLFYFLFFQDNYEKIAGLNKKIESAQEDLKKIKKAAKNFPIHQKELEDVRVLFEATSALLPKSQEIPNLLRNISDMGRISGLDFMSFVPGIEIPKDFYSEIPIDIKTKGPYHNHGMFLDKVSKLERIVTVNNIKTEKVEQDNSEMVLYSSCRLITYRFTNVKLEPPKK